MNYFLIFSLTLCAVLPTHAMQTRKKTVWKLHAAINGGNLEEVRALLDANADKIPENDGCNIVPLVSAALANNEPIARLLIERGARVNTKDINENTALIIAASSSEGLPLCKLLIQHGANVHEKNCSGTTPLHNLADFEGANLKIAALLIAHKADLNAKDNHGDTPLMEAVWTDFETCRFLLAAGADATLLNKDEETALMIAARIEDQPICELIVDALLRKPNKEQKAKLVCFLGLCKYRFKFDVVISNSFKALLPAMIGEENRKNFPESIAYQEVAKIKEGPIQKALLEKYSYKANSNSTNE